MTINIEVPSAFENMGGPFIALGIGLVIRMCILANRKPPKPHNMFTQP